MELFQVRYALAAAECLNFTRAAERCNVTQPALTKAIKSLEEDPGAQIFHREGKRISLSSFGAQADRRHRLRLAEMLAWLVHERDIEPHIPVFDKSDRSDGTLSRADFAYDAQQDVYTWPGGKLLTRFQRRHGCWTDQPHADGFFRYRASKAVATPARSNRDAVPRRSSARSCARSMKVPARRTFG